MRKAYVWAGLFGLVLTATAVMAQPGESAQTDSAPATEQVFETTIAGYRQRVLYVSPSHPVATIVMFPGGSGDVGIGSGGDIRHGDNFVVRSRGLWAAAGFAVLIPDTIDNENLRGQRASAHYADIAAGLVKLARERSPGPVFLLGTSQGSIAAMNGAAHLREGQIAGLVLTESVSRLGGSHETVFDAQPAQVNVPALVVANSDDQCEVAPPLDAPKIAAALRNSHQVKVLQVSGGQQRSAKACGSLSPHGYYGIEQTVVESIVKWMHAQI